MFHISLQLIGSELDFDNLVNVLISHVNFRDFSGLDILTKPDEICEMIADPIPSVCTRFQNNLWRIEPDVILF